ncbi:MFS transporter [Campylobacter lanienae]|uniref:Major facilitator superfamily transporter n=2 Tax=Campylobacter lanienae TaxID=75658 RepID=A0A1X9SME5_9BACT|nr:MFS transporter [Campylobacter lanienae]ARQ97417.1 major facilitator superfamily transporter [Campylobacter lanienae NCTC 13004]
MKRAEILLYYFCTGLTLCILYATQPIGPVFENELVISKTQATLFTTAIMMPLAFAGIFYGYLLEKIQIKIILVLAFLFLGISEIVFSLTHSYFLLLNIRGFQGLLIPAVLTGIMSYISQISSKDSVANAIGVYIGVTIIGGFMGRALSGFFTDIFGWRVFFFIIGCVAILASILLLKFSQNIKASYLKPHLIDIIHTLKTRHNLYIFLMIFGIFFTFQAMLNFIPFELAKISDNYSSSKAGMLYIGYLVGVLVAFNTKKIVAFLGSSIKAIIVGIIILIIAIQIFRIESFWLIFVAMVVFCLGNFIAHSIASGFINKMATSHKGISNGLYVSFYYFGGALGSFVPGFIYIPFGWGAMLSFISVVSFISLIFIMVIRDIKN